MKKLHKSLFICSSFLILTACNTETKTSSKVTSISSDSLVKTHTSFKTAIDTSWLAYQKSDSQKLADMDRLLMEISTIPKHDLLTLKKISVDFEKLKKNKLNLASMKVSASIDKYDFATDSLVTRIVDLTLATPNVEGYTLCNTLVSDINEAQMLRLRLRGDYDQAVRQYNELVEKNKEALKSKNLPTDKFPLFSIPAL